MPPADFPARAAAMREAMVLTQKADEIPGRVFRSLTDEDVGVGAFDAAAARLGAAEHGKTCSNENCRTHLTLAVPSVRLIAVAPTILGPQMVERLFAPWAARELAVCVWAAADLAEGR